MPVSEALKNSAKDFSVKYACNFDFAMFESRVEEFTFLRPNGGWLDVYKMMFDRVYKNTLENAATGALDNLDGEAMLDDFEYTLIRPYVKENESEIKHKPYIGMDRIARLEYLDRLTREAPSNPVELYTEKYKSGELSISQMHRQAVSTLGGNGAERERYIELVGYIQALENANKSRSFVWRALHPFKNNAEKRDAALMKKMFIEEARGGEEFYGEISDAAHETFDGHKKAKANLAQSLICAREEMSRKQKMNDVRRESLRLDGFGEESVKEKSYRVDFNNALTVTKQSIK